MQKKDVLNGSCTKNFIHAATCLNIHRKSVIKSTGYKLLAEKLNQNRI